MLDIRGLKLAHDFDWRRWFESEVSHATDCAMRAHPAGRLWFWYQPSKPGHHGALYVGPDAPAGFKLAASEALPFAADRNRIRAWVDSRARRLPIVDPES